MPKKNLPPPLLLERELLRRYPDLPRAIEMVKQHYGKEYFHRELGAGLHVLHAMGHKMSFEEMSAIPFVTLWRESRVIYRYDAELADILMAQELPKVPCESLLRLPQWCVCITDFDRTRNVVALYAVVDKGRIVILWQYNDGGILMDMFPVHGNQGQAVTSMLSEELLQKISEANRELMTKSINLLLYLCAENAEVHTDRPRPPRISTPKDPDVTELPTRPTVYDVGTRIGAAIREAASANKERDVSEGGRQSGKHASPIPHVRRAHYSTYWTGEGRTTPVVRWIEPVLVGVRGINGDIPTAIRPVMSPNKAQSEGGENG